MRVSFLNTYRDTHTVVCPAAALFVLSASNWPFSAAGSPAPSATQGINKLKPVKLVASSNYAVFSRSEKLIS